MGNRAVISTARKTKATGNTIGLYLHWNGGRDSVEGFLTYCKIKGYRSPSDDCYGWACLAKVVGNFFDSSGDDGLSRGIDTLNRLDCDNYDNGLYVIKGWDIVDRQYHTGGEQHGHKLEDMLLDIDKAQPEGQRLGEEKIKAWIAANPAK